jgi:putative RecB family exonuclease
MPIYSHSRLGTFETCPLQYKFSYIDKIEREQEGVEAFLGSRVHEAMELLYKELKFKTYTVKELLDWYEAQWRKEWHDQIIITKKNRTQNDYYALGKKCIEDYYKRYYPFDDTKVLGLERSINIQLDKEGKYKVRGFIDRIAQDKNGVYEIHDYKTSGSLPDQKHFDEDRQLAFYQIGIESIWNDVKNTKLIWHYVVFDKEMVSTRTQAQLDDLKKETIKLIDDIEGTENFLPQESGLCEWCVYPDLCPKRKHLYKVDAMPANEYLKDDGVKLVNTFAKLAGKKKNLQEKIYEIDEELDKVKEAAIKYAEKEKADVLRGSDYKLKITERQKVSSPAKGSPERQELEKILRDAGKWDEVSDLDTHAMEKSIDEDRWDKKLVNKIKKFLTVDVRKYVSLSKVQDKEK